MRIAFNRDESRARPWALPPQLRRFGDYLAILPVDPISLGSWIASNERGLILALLNANPPGAKRSGGTVSRGRIIPKLLECETLDAAMRAATQLEWSSFAPFRLVLATCEAIADLEWDGDQTRWSEVRPLSQPHLFTSSGLGDDLVRPPREALFRERFQNAQPAEWAKIQDDFHRHSWPDQPHLSVCMRRERSCTVSLTVIEADTRSIDWIYYDGAPDKIDQAQMARLLIRPAKDKDKSP